MFANTELFRSEAQHFLKHGYYCPDPEGSIGFKKYWDEQLKRCVDGYSVAGTRITGDHYFYLNFCRILLTQEENTNERVSKKKKKTGIKTVSFPDFWDGDYMYFNACEEARNQGLHLAVAKSRRKGYSYKNSSKSANAYNTVRKSTSIIGAFDTKYLYPEGAMTMVAENLDFLNEHTAWRKRRLIDSMGHKKAGYKEIVDGRSVEKGYLSQVMGISFYNNPSAARGKSPYYVFFEEAGTFDNLMDSYMATIPAVEDGDVTTGQIIVFGTGGEMDKGTLDFEKLFYDPETYNLMPFNNVWDEGASGTKCGFFHPVFLNKVGYMDKDGNSNIELAKESEELIRKKIREGSKDPNAIDKRVAEYPFCPRESFLRANHNLFPIALLNEWRNRMESSGIYRDIGVNGFIEQTAKGPEFKPSVFARPLLDYPIKQTEDTTGCVVMYQTPYRNEAGEVPPGMYLLVNDPFAHGGEYSMSVGASYVVKMLNGVSKPDDMIVASYIGKPSSQDEYNRNMFDLAKIYNAKVAFENDRGDVIGYARRKGLTHMLMEEVEIIDPREQINIRKLGRTFGISMGSGHRKNQAIVWLRDWLLTPRGKDEEGNIKFNLHFIYDPGLVSELIAYGDGNFDRVSAMLVLMFYIQDIYSIPSADDIKNVLTTDELFKRPWFV